MAKNSSTEDLRAELAELANTLEDVLNQGRDKSQSELAKLHQRAQAALDTTRERLGQSGERIADSTRQAARKADHYVQDNPWHGVGLGAAIGLIAGILISRR